MTVRRSACLTALGTALLLSPAAGVSPAAATDACGSGLPFAVSTAGTLHADDREDWWQTVSTGTTSVRLYATDPDVWLDVYDADCAIQCGGPLVGCDVTSAGPLHIRVYQSGSAVNDYAIAAVPVGSPEALGASQCDDGLDNDLDGETDLGDPDCVGSNDPREAPPSQPPSCTQVAGAPACASVETGQVVASETLVVPTAELSFAEGTRVVGTLDIYRFGLPTGGFLTVPCVVLTADSSAANLCGNAGGTFVSRIAVLADQTIDTPVVSPKEPLPLATVSVCEATVTVTVAGIGIESFPAVTLC